MQCQDKNGERSRRRSGFLRQPDPNGQPHFKTQNQARKCATSDRGRTIRRSIYEDYRAKVRGYHTTEPYKKAIRKRQVWVEPLFAEAKEWHGLRRLRIRGLLNANIEGLLIAAGQNLKRLLAATGWGRRHAPCGSLLALPRGPWQLSAVYG